MIKCAGRLAGTFVFPLFGSPLVGDGFFSPALLPVYGMRPRHARLKSLEAGTTPL